MTFILILGLVAALAQPPSDPPPADARDAASADRTVYDRAYFVSARPNTAFDMLARIPGFVFDPGLAARGYAGTAGNVLVDGERPATKNDNLQDYLGRIPALNVARIELIRGGARGIDMQGRAVIANIVLVRGSRRTLVSNTYLKPYGDGGMGYGARLDGAWTRQAGAVTGSLFVFGEQGLDAGKGTAAASLPGGAGLGTQTFQITNPERGVSLRGAVSGGRPGAEVKLQGNYNHVDFRERQSGAGAGLIAGDFVNVTDLNDNGEVSLDYSPPGFGKASLLVLQSFRSETTRSDARQFGVLTRFASQARSGETIARATARSTWGGLALEGGLEAAYNRLDPSSRLLVAGTPTALPGGDVGVREVRAEPFLTLRPPAVRGLQLELGWRTEISRISVERGAVRPQILVYPKPRLLATWSLSTADQLRLRVEREVGQLDFGAFASTADLAKGVVNTGNPALRPQRAWTYEIAYERRFWGAGSVVATATHARLQDVVDQTAIGGVSAVGNIGDGARDTIQLVLSAPLARLGLAQGRLSVNGIWRDSHVRDPFTGADRGISDEIQREGSVVLSNDVARWKSTWTLAATEGVRQTRYRVSEISRSGLQTTVDASWEYKPGGGLAVLVQIKDLFGRDRTLSRDLFAGARGATPPGLSLVQRVSQAPYLYVRLRRAF